MSHKIERQFRQIVLQSNEDSQHKEFLSEDQIIVFDFQSYSALIINFKEKKDISYMWVITSSSDETYKQIFDTIFSYSRCFAISNNERCMYLYIGDNGVETIFMSTADGTRYNEDEEYYTSVQDFLLGITEKYYSGLSSHIISIIQ